MSSVIVSDFNADLFVRLLNNLIPDSDRAKSAGYGQVYQQLFGIAAVESRGDESRPSNLIVWVRPEAIFSSLRKAIAYEDFSAEELNAEVNGFADAVIAAAGCTSNVFVMSMYSHEGNVTHGMLNYRAGTGVRYWIDKINVDLAERFSGSRNIYLLDVSRYMRGAAPVNSKLYYTAKVPYALDVFKSAAQDLKYSLDGLRGKARRVLVLDLDNTMWGGVLGDVGTDGIILGGHDHAGEAFIDFQRVVKSLANRGVALAIASKNYEENALKVFDEHPEMLIRRADLSAWRINWNDKAQNISDIADELNLGLSSFVFIDDNPLERARVSEALPEVFVPEWPVDPAQYADALRALQCFNVPSVSLEDSQRTKMFAAERERKELKAALSHDEWLKTIAMQINIEPAAASNLSRIVQLINKSNQFNARNRRVSEAEVLEWQKNTGAGLWAFRVSDKYGDSGLTGVISSVITDEICHITDFVMSCRVMGRGVEQAMLGNVIGFAQEHGSVEVVCDFLMTERNDPMRDFLDSSGMCRVGDRYSWSIDRAYPMPKHIAINKGEG